MRKRIFGDSEKHFLFFACRLKRRVKLSRQRAKNQVERSLMECAVWEKHFLPLLYFLFVAWAGCEEVRERRSAVLEGERGRQNVFFFYLKDQEGRV